MVFKNFFIFLRFLITFSDTSAFALLLALIYYIMYIQFQMRCYMKELKLNEFLDRADDFINNASIGEEFYAVETNSGKAIVISEDEWKMLTDAMRVAMGCNPKHCD